MTACNGARITSRFAMIFILSYFQVCIYVYLVTIVSSTAHACAEPQFPEPSRAIASRATASTNANEPCRSTVDEMWTLLAPARSTALQHHPVSVLNRFR